MNYRYSFTDKDIILSEAEHNFCQEAQKKGQMIFSLRGGDLGLNMALVKYWDKSYELTPQQEKEREAALKLEAPAEKVVPNERLKEMSRAFKERMGWLEKSGGNK